MGDDEDTTGAQIPAPGSFARDAFKLTTAAIETMANAALDGTPVGEAAAAWLRAHRDALVGMGVEGVREVFASLRDADGDAQGIYQAKLAYVNTLPWDLVQVVQQQSADKLAQHADARVRMASIFDPLAAMAGRLAPKIFDVLLAVI